MLRKRNKADQPDDKADKRIPMLPPELAEGLHRRRYPKLAAPPAARAHLWAEPEANAIYITYNDADIVTMKLPAGAVADVGLCSEGSMQSEPFIQQFTISCSAPAQARIEFTASGEMCNMRARRAEAGEAILGQLGNPLIYGANGMYFVDWDLLLSLHGPRFSWIDEAITHDASGYHAALEIELGPMPLTLLLRPRYYAQHLGYRRHMPWRFKPNPKAIAAWASRDAFQGEFSEKDICEAVAKLLPFRRYGLEYLQLDGGFQEANIPLYSGSPAGESWLKTNFRFPGGHEVITDAIVSGGFKPAIWTNPAFTNADAALHDGCCLCKPDGTLIKADGIRYLPDCSNETLAKHVAPLYRNLRAKGYELFKLGSLKALFGDGLLEAAAFGTITYDAADARMAAYLRTVRAGIGLNSYLLADRGAPSQCVGCADALRIAPDSDGTWASYSMQLRESARWYFAQRILFTLDPDMIRMGGRYEYLRMMLSFVSLMGGIYAVSGKPAAMSAQERRLLECTLPPLETCAAETGPVDFSTPACLTAKGDDESVCRLISGAEDGACPAASLWAFHINHGGRTWCVVQRAAIVPLKAVVISGEALGLDPSHKYYSYNFWAQRGSRVNGDAIALPELALGDTIVLALTDITSGHPVLVGSSRHVSMDAVSVKNAQSCIGGYMLELAGFKGMKCEYAVFAGKLHGRIKHVQNAKAECARDGELIRVKVEFEAEAAEVTIS